MNMSASKKSSSFKLINFVLIFAFSFYNLSFGAITGDIGKPAVAEKPVPKLSSVDDIGIALDNGTIESKYTGTTGKTIVHIQDAHCNFEAQNNINNILEQLTTENGINMISLEGAEGIVDTAWFKAFPDAEIRKEVATYFMKKGEITGAEFFSITTDYSGTMFGAETKEYYVKNLHAFTSVYPYKDLIEKYFKDVEGVADRVKGIVYTPQLKKLDFNIKAFEKKEMELSDFAAYLGQTSKECGIKLEDRPNFTKLMGTLEYEKKINFDIVDSERSAYIDALGKKLSKKKMAALVAESISFKKGHIKAVDFYTYLRDLAKELNIPMVQQYPNLFYYYLYTKQYEGIDNRNLFAEIDSIKRAIKEKLFKDDTQRKLDKYSEMLGMFVALVNIELTNENYDMFKGYSKEFTLADVVDFVTKLSERYNLNAVIDPITPEISDNIPNMVNFYEVAMKRDEVLLENTLKEMDKEGKNSCVLLAGGFHTRGIKTILESKGVSYVVVTPKITKDVETPYIKVLTNQRTSLEDIITESAAMPGVSAMNQDENGTAKPEGKMLGAVLRSWLVALYRNGDPSLGEFSKMIGEIEKGSAGRTAEEVAKETYEEMVLRLVTGWAVKMKDAAISDEQAKAKWEKAVTDGALKIELESAYLSLYEDLAKNLAANERLMAVEVITRAFTAWASTETKMVRLNKNPNSDKYESLTEKQKTALRGIIGEKILQGEPEATMPVNKDDRYPHRVPGVMAKGYAPDYNVMRVHVVDNLIEEIEKHNASVVDEESKIPLDVAVIPTSVDNGLYTGRYPVMVIGRVYWEILSESERQRLADHELHHIVSPSHTEDETISWFKGDALEDIRDKFRKVYEEKITHIGVYDEENPNRKYKENNGELFPTLGGTFKVLHATTIASGPEILNTGTPTYKVDSLIVKTGDGTEKVIDRITVSGGQTISIPPVVGEMIGIGTGADTRGALLLMDGKFIIEKDGTPVLAGPADDFVKSVTIKSDEYKQYTLQNVKDTPAVIFVSSAPGENLIIQPWSAIRDFSATIKENRYGYIALDTMYTKSGLSSARERAKFINSALGVTSGEKDVFEITAVNTGSIDQMKQETLTAARKFQADGAIPIFQVTNEWYKKLEADKEFMAGLKLYGVKLAPPVSDDVVKAVEKGTLTMPIMEMVALVQGRLTPRETAEGAPSELALRFQQIMQVYTGQLISFENLGKMVSPLNDTKIFANDDDIMAWVKSLSSFLLKMEAFVSEDLQNRLKARQATLQSV